MKAHLFLDTDMTEPVTLPVAGGEAGPAPGAEVAPGSRGGAQEAPPARLSRLTLQPWSLLWWLAGQSWWSSW